MTSITSPIDFRARDGRRIVGIQVTTEGDDRQGTVVAVPPLGATVDHLTILWRKLSRSFRHVVSFDPIDHTGRSDGTVYDYNLSSVLRDIEVVCAEVEPSLLVGMSLSARACTRYMAQGPINSITDVRLGMPVVDIEKTINIAADEDCFEAFRVEESFSRTWSDLEVGGRFFQDAIDANWCGVDQSAADVAASRIPVTAVVGNEDPWVASEDIKAVFGTETTWLRLNTHEVLRQPIQAVRLFRTLATTERANVDNYRVTDMMGELESSLA